MLTIIPKRLLRISCRESTKRLLVSAVTASEKTKDEAKLDRLRNDVLHYRYVYPEFLPDPQPSLRNKIREKLERNDMMTRRTKVDIPEFYVGTIMAVELSDKHTPGKTQRFAGICILRRGCGLRAEFILRNVIDHQGVEILYQLYDPAIQKIDVLKLEKRLDDDLLYLRDALPEYSTFDSDMLPEILPEGTPVPVNPIKVKLKPRPWVDRWERKNLQGVQDLELPERFYERAKELEKPWEKYDLMKQYMKTIPAEEQTEIFSELQTKLQTMETQMKKMKKKRTFIKPVKLA